MGVIATRITPSVGGSPYFIMDDRKLYRMKTGFEDFITDGKYGLSLQALMAEKQFLTAIRQHWRQKPLKPYKAEHQTIYASGAMYGSG